LSFDKGDFFRTKCALRHVKYTFGARSMSPAREVPVGVSGTLNFTLCEAQCFTAALPLLHLGAVQSCGICEMRCGAWGVISYSRQVRYFAHFKSLKYGLSNH